ncbi:lytic transglycosylase domain-containing protein [Rugamonas apoptosis]|uniref:Lytic transglycosylase domain-containing protein n=1 Tax=Rugamonas apoptosis TaxID=2758570 RepID=A0A7W2INA9_9BURK|nr:lytic transglycosylase domain-containing protein [Rugamonas apoptosis]MBA5690543.1 lytic transglycosylase domain-containing protein [Rugamonas apoptosis]
MPACVAQAAADYSIPLRALIAIRMTEGGQTGTVSYNKNKTADYGPFQINTQWIRQFKRQYGITADQLTNDMCMSARAAAYILRFEINAAGGDFWSGIGHYHSHTAAPKAAYQAAVYRNSLKF